MTFPPPRETHTLAEDVDEASRRLDLAEQARMRALRAWEDSDEPYPLTAAIALEAAERDLRIAREHLGAIRRALEGASTAEDEEAPSEKSWGGH